MKNVITFLGIVFLLCSCGLKPYYSDTHRQEILHKIYVDIVEPSDSYDSATLHAALVKKFASAPPAEFSLKISLTKTKTDLVVKADSDVQRIRVKLTTQYQLIRLRDGAIIKTGQVTSGDSYDMPKQAYIELLSEEYVIKNLMDELVSKYELLLSRISFL